MIPPHTCTPFCDGQRYCVEPGTHTIGVAVRRGFTETDFRTDGVLGKIFIRAVECPDPPTVYRKGATERVGSRSARLCRLPRHRLRKGNRMLKVFITRGLPAAGKSTWARKMLEEYPNAYKRINRDDLRMMLDNGKWSGDREKFVVKVQSALILLALEEKRHVIIDDCNLSPTNLARIENLVRGKAEVEVVDFTDVSVDECVARDQKRANYVGEAVIKKMWRQWLVPRNAQTIKPQEDNGLPKAIICDIDGTLALHNGRDPYDMVKCESDLCNESVREIVEQFSTRGRHILFVSGREEKYRDLTASWIGNNLAGLTDFHLFMRSTDDKRKDDIVKREIYERDIVPRWQIQFVIDDRQRVVDMWRSLGLVCLQCDYGDF